MQYQFKCENHGEFEVSQPMLSEHTAKCPVCGVTAQRIYCTLKHIWDGSTFRPDGSFRPDSDFDSLKG